MKKGVDEDALRELLSRSKRKSKKGLDDIHKGLTSMAKGSSSRRATLFKNLLDMYSDRDVKVKEVKKVFKHLNDILGRQNKNLLDWEHRFEALVRGANNGSSEKKESA